jgi:hypothetical protein
MILMVPFILKSNDGRNFMYKKLYLCLGIGLLSNGLHAMNEGDDWDMLPEAPTLAIVTSTTSTTTTTSSTSRTSPNKSLPVLTTPASTSDRELEPAAQPTPTPISQQQQQKGTQTEPYLERNNAIDDELQGMFAIDFFGTLASSGAEAAAENLGVAFNFTKKIVAAGAQMIAESLADKK